MNNNIHNFHNNKFSFIELNQKQIIFYSKPDSIGENFIMTHVIKMAKKKNI